ncbi:MAG: hypothetical protein ABUS57_07350 [Pseudomonadota bacterium]
MVAAGVRTSAFTAACLGWLALSTPVYAADTSLPAAAYMQHGLPDPARAWTPDQYEAVITTLAALPPEQLPHSASAASGAVMDRLVDAHSLALCDDRATPLNDRFTKCLVELNATARMMRLYITAYTQDHDRALDLARVTGLAVHAVSALSRLANELGPTVDPHAPDYATRMQGLAQMKEGAATTLRGTTTMISAVGEIPEDGRLLIAQATVDEWPTLSGFMTPEGKAQVVTMLQDRATHDPNAQIRALLAPLH